MNWYYLIFFVIVFSLVNPLTVYAVDRSRSSSIDTSWIDKCKTCQVINLTMEESNCIFEFDQLVAISKMDMPLENKKELVTKMVDEFFECALPEQKEEIEKEFVPSLLLDLVLLGEKSDKQTKQILDNTNTINEKTDRIIELEGQQLSIAIVFVAIGIFSGIIIKKYV